MSGKRTSDPGATRTSRIRRRWLYGRTSLALALAAPFVLHGSAPPPTGATPQERPPRAIAPLRLAPVRTAVAVEPDTAAQLLSLTLTGGDGDLGASPPVVAPTPLAAERLAELLGRLPPIPEPAGAAPLDGSGDAPDRSSGGPADPPPPSEPLRVVAVTPAGETELAPHVTVVFSRPMVALGMDGEPIAGSPPASLEPQPPGVWRWLDVRTLRFEPASGRLPGATEFTVRVPDGVRSSDGGLIDEAVVERFRTAGVRALGGYPNDILTDLDPTILLTFDQRVEAEAVVAAARLASAGATHPLRIVPLAELTATDTALAETARRAAEGTWAALRPIGPLPAGSEATLRLGPELTSLEGPLPAGRAQEMRFEVRGPLELSIPCGDPGSPCRPFGRMSLGFTNPLEPAQDLGGIVRIEPAIADLGVAIQGSRLWLTGEFQPRSTYRLRVEGRIRDTFGQVLGAAEEHDLHFGTPFPFVRIPGDAFVHLDPARGGRLDLPVRSVGGVAVELHRVDAGDWQDVQDSLRFAAIIGGGPWRPAREPLRRWTIEGDDAAARGFAELAVDLSTALEAGGNQLLLLVEGLPPAGEEGLHPWSVDRPPWDVAWIQTTSFGVAAAWDSGTLVAWVASLVDGTPLEGVEIELPEAGVRAVTDAQGLARLPRSAGGAAPVAGRPVTGPRGDVVLVARLGREVAVLPAPVAGTREGSWMGDPRFPAPLWHVITDRRLYRPGEEMVVHGWIRVLAGDPRRDLAFPEGVDSLRYQVRPARGVTVSEGVVPVSAAGAFHLRIDLPADVPSGAGQVLFTALSGGQPVESWTGRAGFQVEEFRRPEYEVLAEVDPGPHLPGDTVAARVQARYFDGGPLPDAGVTWRASATSTTWSPVGWGGWRFGPWGRRAGARQARAPEHRTRTDARGDHHLLMLAEHLAEPYPASLGLLAQIEDIDRQAGSAATSTVVHPASVAAGVRSERLWVRIDEPVSFDVVTVDLDGGVRPDVVAEVRVAHLGSDGWSARQAGDEEPTPVPVRCAPAQADEAVNGTAVRALRCRFVAERSGRYAIDADVRDASGRRSRTSLDVWALGRTGGFLGWPPSGGMGVDLRPDRESYAAGDTARVLLTTPWPSARGLLTVQRYGLREVRPIHLNGPSEELRIPIAHDDAGGLDLIATLTPGAGAPDELQARVRLRVDEGPRRLAVEVAPRTARLEPGGEGQVDVRVTRADGAPAAGGEVALWVVDEAVLALAGYTLGDPLPGFLRPDAAGPSDVHLPHATVLWGPRPLGPGTVTARLLDADWGTPTSWVEVLLEGTDLRTGIRDGRLVLGNVPVGTHRLVIRRGQEVLLVREIVVPAEGLDLGTLLVGTEQDRGPPPPEGSRRVMLASTLSLAEVAVTGFQDGEGRIRTRGGAMEELAPPAEPAGPPVALRELFRVLAAFEPSVRLDADGRASVPIRLPDTMTRYRILAIAADGPHRFGTGESSLTATRDLIVRASPPRVLHPGDRPELPVVVQNAGERPLQVDVVARTSGGLPLVGGAGYHLRLAPGARHELRFPARAARIGAPLLDVLAVGTPVADAPAEGALEPTDAVRVAIPVRPVLAPRAAAVYQRLTPASPIRLALETPRRAEPGFGALDVTLSSSPLGPLVEVIRGLCLHPWLWPEPTIARVLGLSALDARLDVLGAPDLPASAGIRELVARDIERILAWLQPWRYSVRVGYTVQGADALGSAFTRVHAIHALHEASRSGYDVTEQMVAEYGSELVRTWQHERAHLASRDRPASGWDHASAAYALYVAARTGAPLPESEVSAWLAELIPQDLPVEALAWLLALAAASPDRAATYEAFLTELENRALTTAATVTFRQGGRATAASADGTLERLLLASSRRSDAAALAVLVEVAPEHRLIDGLVRGLLGHRDGTPAGGAHENGWVLMALGRYAAATSAPTSALTALVRLDGAVLAEESFAGDRHASVHLTREPPAPGRDATLEITGSGSGTLQVRAAIRYAPLATTDLPAEERGFLVSRRYEAVDDSGDVRRDPDGTWRIRAGARVRVRVMLTAPARRFQVQLADPLPGGLEPLNAALRGTGFTDDPGPGPAASSPWSQVSSPLRGAWPPDPYTWDWTDISFRVRSSWLGWATHQELRDDRLEAYTPYMAAGTYESTYLVRATTPGTFLAGPVRVEESEHPETFGQGVIDRVVIEARPR